MLTTFTVREGWASQTLRLYRKNEVRAAAQLDPEIKKNLVSIYMYIRRVLHDGNILMCVDARFVALAHIYF